VGESEGDALVGEVDLGDSVVGENVVGGEGAIEGDASVGEKVGNIGEDEGTVDDGEELGEVLGKTLGFVLGLVLGLPEVGLIVGE